MKLRNILLSSTIILSSLAAGAQNKEATELTFIPHWYIQGQFGAQETLGETSFNKLLSPNAQIGVGYKFNPYIGARLSVNAWQSKGAYEYNGNKNVYKWNYVAPTIDVTADLTNIIGGYKDRKFSVGVFAGIGANIGFSNDEAGELKNEFNALPEPIDAFKLYWDETKVRLVGKFGASFDYNINDRFSVGLEMQANVLTDHYNSKQAHNADWYFNALVGVKYALGKTQAKKVVTVPAVAPVVKTETVHDTIYVDRIVEKEVPVKADKSDSFRRDVFFTISNVKVSDAEMTKVKEVAEYMKANPDSKVSVTGYADKGTGSLELNLRLSKQRAETVAKVLRDKFGIPNSRIMIDSMDNSVVQPFEVKTKNRVAICIVD